MIVETFMRDAHVGLIHQGQHHLAICTIDASKQTWLHVSEQFGSIQQILYCQLPLQQLAHATLQLPDTCLLSRSLPSIVLLLDVVAIQGLLPFAWALAGLISIPGPHRLEFGELPSPRHGVVCTVC